MNHVNLARIGVVSSHLTERALRGLCVLRMCERALRGLCVFRMCERLRLPLGQCWSALPKLSVLLDGWFCSLDQQTAYVTAHLKHTKLI